MKSSLIRSLTALAVCGLALAFPVTGFADHHEKAKDKGKQMKSKHDTDKDGQLSEAERVAKKEAEKARAKERHAEDLAKYDADKDGKLSKEEKDAMKADKDAMKEKAKAEKDAMKAEKKSKSDKN
jgi:Rieske Fe-S protein